MAGSCKNIKLDKDYKELTQKEIRSLNKAGMRLLKKDHVLDRIEELKEIVKAELEEKLILSKNEIYIYLSKVIKRADISKSLHYAKYGIAASVELIKRYENDAVGVKIELVDPTKGRQKK